ncbi:hypothetical protein [uncultured Algoriphagus sp.]
MFVGPARRGGTIHTNQGRTPHDDGDHLLQQVNSSITSVYFLFILLVV